MMNDELGIRDVDGGMEASDDAASSVGEGLAAPDTPNTPDAPDTSTAPDSPDEPDAPDTPDSPDAAAEDTFIALLPGEEPLIIDTDIESPDTDESAEPSKPNS